MREFVKSMRGSVEICNVHVVDGMVPPIGSSIESLVLEYDFNFKLNFVRHFSANMLTEYEKVYSQENEAHRQQSYSVACTLKLTFAMSTFDALHILQ